MVSHTSRGGTIEVMGLLQGRIRGDTFLITDCFPLPVEGTETRVNAGEAANEFMVAFTELNEQTRFSSEPVVGWYHSHPGYGCWLSGIDVATQLLYQSHQDPFLAIVIDPLRTEALGRVDIGAFRVYPDSYSPPDTKESRSDIPIEKVQDFGVHCKRYYPLEVSFNKSKFDQVVIDRVWADHWAHMISSSDWLDVKRRYFQDLNRASNALDPEDPESIRRFAKNVEQCSCKFIAETVFEQLKQRVFAPIGERMDTSS
jgi:COP9 signalosome complex subunit 5